MRNYIIEVEGEIIAKDVNQYAVNWACGAIGGDPESIADNYEFDERRHAVKGNLVLNKNKRAVPYASYFAKKGIQIYGGGDIYTYGSSSGPAFAYYRDNVERLKAKIEIEAPVDIQDSLYNSLYLEGFSILELFLSDFTLCLCFQSDKIFEKATTYILTHKKKENNDGLCGNEYMTTDLAVRKYFTSSMVFHRFEQVKKLFAIMDINMPRTKELECLLHKRNNIVHRNAYSNIDGMRYTNATKEDVLKLIEVCNKFVNELEKVL